MVKIGNRHISMIYGMITKVETKELDEVETRWSTLRIKWLRPGNGWSKSVVDGQSWLSDSRITLGQHTKIHGIG